MVSLVGFVGVEKEGDDGGQRQRKDGHDNPIPGGCNDAQQAVPELWLVVGQQPPERCIYLRPYGVNNLHI